MSPLCTLVAIPHRLDRQHLANMPGHIKQRMADPVVIRLLSVETYRRLVKLHLGG